MGLHRLADDAGISNLREFQFTTLSADAKKGDRVNWSGEIMTDSWVHVAIVNDPATMTTTMYVDGAPVLRNALDTAGMTWNRGMPWILGADWMDDMARNGWNGCISETRIIDHPTAADEWLTQRADLTGLRLTSAPAPTPVTAHTVSTAPSAPATGSPPRVWTRRCSRSCSPSPPT